MYNRYNIWTFMNRAEFKDKLKKTGLTQKEFALITDYSYSAVKGWETVPKWALLLLDYLEMINKIDNIAVLTEDILELKKSTESVLQEKKKTVEGKRPDVASKKA